MGGLNNSNNNNIIINNQIQEFNINNKFMKKKRVNNKINMKLKEISILFNFVKSMIFFYISFKRGEFGLRGEFNIKILKKESA